MRVIEIKKLQEILYSEIGKAVEKVKREENATESESQYIYCVAYTNGLHDAANIISEEAEFQAETV